MNDNSIPQIIPAILAITEQQYLEKLENIEDSGLFKNSWVQIDLMDNKFVHNQSIGPLSIRKYKTNLKLEAHLMVRFPENWIDDLIKSDIKRIIFPVEDAEGIAERIDHIKNHGIEVGISVNPETAVAKLLPFFDKIDMSLIMSVHPGFSGQEFIENSLLKIEQAKDFKKYFNFKIEVDGGINENNIQRVVNAGADCLVIGSHLIDGNIKKNFQKIYQQLQIA